MVILSYNFIKRPTFTAVLILQIDFGNIADVLTGWWRGHGKMPNIQNPKNGFAHYAVLNHRPTRRPVRITPDAMRQYRSTNDMLGLCCLCPLINPTGPDFVEAAIYLATSGTYVGQYVASCAKDNCGYLGEFHYLPVVGLLVVDLVVLNTSISTNGGILYLAWPIYQGVPSERCDEPHALVNKLTYRLYQAFGERVPPPVTHTSEGLPSQTVPQGLVPHRPLKRTYAMMGELQILYKPLFVSTDHQDKTSPQITWKSNGRSSASRSTTPRSHSTHHRASQVESFRNYS